MYSLEIRKQILELISTGKSQRDVGRDFNIPFRTIQRWMRAVRDGKGLEPKNHQAKFYKINREKLKNFVEENPNLTLKEIAVVFNVHWSSIWRNLHILNIHLKRKYKKINKL